MCVLENTKRWVNAEIGQSGRRRGVSVHHETCREHIRSSLHRREWGQEGSSEGNKNVKK